MTYSLIAIIYNPNSTGPSHDLAKDLQKRVNSQLPKQATKLYATEYAGHAEELAYEIAISSQNPLIISSSGDGGYHEIINGAMKAQHEMANPTVGLLPGGNANDHYNYLHTTDIIEQIANNSHKTIDVLRLQEETTDNPVDRYAHSYIGLGLTPWAGKKLTETKLNSFNEIIVALKAFITVRQVHIRTAEGLRSYSSVIFSNIDTMAKVLQISSYSKINDGKFEVTTFKTRNKFKLLLQILRATVAKVEHDMRTSSYSFETVGKILVQLDGEVFTLTPKTRVTIQIEADALKCIV